jgi:ABC-type lipoprotein export system ATPase subunit
MDAGTALLKLENARKEYASGSDASRLQVLRGINLEARAGESVAIVGPSGSGKSTLLNLMGALDQPTDGRVFFEGEALSSLPPERLAAIRNTRIGFVFQAHHLLPQCTALENVLVPTLARGGAAARGKAVERALRLMERVGLSARLNHFPGQLSGGERQRVAVVRALIHEPVLLLADEPTGALDRKSAEDLSRLLVELNREEGLALIVATHASGLAGLMRRVLRLCDGELVADEQTENCCQ